MGEGLRRLILKAAGHPLPANSCEHNPEPTELHSCPFQEEINNDKEFQCGCCKACTLECLWDT